jgi:hypothetical protein
MVIASAVLAQATGHPLDAWGRWGVLAHGWGALARATSGFPVLPLASVTCKIKPAMLPKQR